MSATLGARLEPPATRGGPWVVELHWAEIGGRAEVVGVEVRSFRRPRDGGVWGPTAHLPTQAEATQILTAETLRQVPLGRLTDEVRRAASTRWRDVARRRRPNERYIGMGKSWAPSDITSEQAEAWGSSTPGSVLEGLQKVAEVYTTAHRAGEPPTGAVGQHFQITHSAAAKRVSRARAAGLLPQTSRGRAAIATGVQARQRRRRTP